MGLADTKNWIKFDISCSTELYVMHRTRLWCVRLCPAIAIHIVALFILLYVVCLDCIKKLSILVSCKCNCLCCLQAGAQEKFMRIKHAYNTLLTSKSRGKYDTGKQGSDYSYSTGGFQTRTREAEEEFYGLGINLL